MDLAHLLTGSTVLAYHTSTAHPTSNTTVQAHPTDPLTGSTVLAHQTNTSHPAPDTKVVRSRLLIRAQCPQGGGGGGGEEAAHGHHMGE